jgi:hypothetical protein
METPNYAREIAHLERIAADKLDEIMKLQHTLASEQDKTMKCSQQIDEMTDFLADYGLHWVGGPGPTNVSSFPRGPTDMPLFMQHIAELNSMVGAGVALKKDNSRITKIGECSIRICLQEEGFTLDGGRLRLYSHPLSSDFFKDIMDGFFPVEFKGKYPEGVKMIVEDCRTNDLFKGKARRLIESARREKRRPLEIGEGDGVVRVRFSDGFETNVKAHRETTIAQVRALIIDNFRTNGFVLSMPPSLDAVGEEKNLGDLGLFPRGILLVSGGESTDH